MDWQKEENISKRKRRGSHDAGHEQWEQFPNLLTVAGVMLFIFERLLMSGGASAQELLRDLPCTLKCPA